MNSVVSSVGFLLFAIILAALGAMLHWVFADWLAPIALGGGFIYCANENKKLRKEIKELREKLERK